MKPTLKTNLVVAVAVLCISALWLSGCFDGFFDRLIGHTMMTLNMIIFVFMKNTGASIFGLIVFFGALMVPVSWVMKRVDEDTKDIAFFVLSLIYAAAINSFLWFLFALTFRRNPDLYPAASQADSVGSLVLFSSIALGLAIAKIVIMQEERIVSIKASA
ncbi:hypothetical protein [Brucella pseudogrignonensis]|uniref:Lipoprotein n=1 Tax=Brucella pseudogrignonensis TaxID=419475 RepID=A0ABU1MFD6_9HYPH|nr:hypothetical protein [Brucella pseudogrignonensis]MDR6434613.1 hypothetical protein [Brucella pseudogrignonensis]